MNRCAWCDSAMCGHGGLYCIKHCSVCMAAAASIKGRPDGWSNAPVAPVAPAAPVRDSATRKGQPIATGVLAYFPLAMIAISEVSRKGNDKHNPGQPLHWAKEKSTDEADACVRHIVDALREGPLALDAEGVPHLHSAAWRMLAWLERVQEGDERWKGVAR